ncbi:MAG: metallophosphoesterase family protein [Flavobacteriales bacterium]|nr:metallophosphoesterase family protein [Flavobacteriales bacterium]
MKRNLFFLLALALPLMAFSQAKKAFSIVTCPAQDASKGMNVSWGADTLSRENYLIYTTVKDADWKKAVKVAADTRLCLTYDTIYSKNEKNENVYENVRFTKCDVALSGLKPNTQYKYRIGEAGEEHFFKTAGSKNWSACIISDFHSYTPLGKRLTNAMAMIDKVKEYDPSMDWILHLGDITAWGGSYSFWEKMYQEPYFKEYMWAGVNGNHDNMTRKYRLSNEFFRDAAFYPRNGYQGEEGVCYYFTYKNALFIMLNNEHMHSDETLSAAQEWVRSVVKANKAKYVIVCEHYQWFYGNDGKTSQYGRWSKVFDELGVDLALSGNNHIYARTNAIYADAQTDGTKGTVYIQTPSSDGERGVTITDSLKYNTDKIKFRWSEGGNTIGAMSMQVTEKEMVLTLFDRNGKKIDTATVLAKKK